MPKRTNVLLMLCAVVALQPLVPIASLADDGDAPARQEGEDRWVPSLAITSGVSVQGQQGSADSALDEDGSPNPVFLQGFVDGDDLAASPFVGGNLEVMTPALPIPTRPRLFLSGELLPTFASDRDVALKGDPGCIHGPRAGALCERDLTEWGTSTFAEDSANGQGSRTSARVDLLVFGASAGVAFPARIGKRQLRIKPSVGWISYKVNAEGLVVDADCNPESACTPRENLRETTLMGSGSQRFNGIGPGLDIEMDAGRFGPLGVSLFLGARAYHMLGDRTLAFDTTQNLPRRPETGVLKFPEATATAAWEVEVDPWMYRGHVGIRFQWLGSRE